jgi:trehalose synthase
MEAEIVATSRAGPSSPKHYEGQRAAQPRRVEVKRKAVESYRAIVGDDAIAELRDLAFELRGLRVLELSSTATGGGVAEVLSSSVPLERDLGIDSEWRLIAGDGRFFEITKKIHNGLQGMPIQVSVEETQEYLRQNEATAKSISDSWDLVFVHDPQPAAVRSFMGDVSCPWIWRCHLDSSSPHPPVWEFVRPFVESHDCAIFTLESFIPPGLATQSALLVPAIDPLSSKNRSLPSYLARETVDELGVDLARPLLLQVSRFDPWKDPLGVVDVWRQVRETFPNVQLALVGAMATDDPEGWRIYGEIERETRDEPSCFLLTNQMGVASHEVNALQRVADVALQKSIREGFGLIVSETLWKGTAMVAGRAGGIPVQLEDGVSGYLADSGDGFAARIVELLEQPAHARELGVAGIRRVREGFLIPRLLRDKLRLMRELTSGSRQLLQGERP